MNPKFLLLSLLFATSAVHAEHSLYQPQPVLKHEGRPLIARGAANFPNNFQDLSVTAIATKGFSTYLGAGPTLTKFDAAGKVLWKRTYSYRTVNIVVGGQTQTNYYESWGDGQSFQPGSGNDSGEIFSPLAQKIVIDSKENIYVYFNDQFQRYRGLLVKFDADGKLVWRAPSSYPLQGFDNASYNTTEQAMFKTDLLVLPGEKSVALFESFSNGSLFIFTTGTTLPATLLSRVTVVQAARKTSIDANGVVLFSKQLGEQNQNAAGVGMLLNPDKTLVVVTQEGPKGQPLKGANKLIMRTLRSPFTGFAAVSGQAASGRATEEWNDVVFGLDGNLYLGGNAPKTIRQCVASYTFPTFQERWTKEILPAKAVFFDTYPPAQAYHIFASQDGVAVASDSKRGNATLSLAKVGFDGKFKWTINSEFSGGFPAYEPQSDLLGNIFFIGSPDSSSYSIWKFSAAGIFQYAAKINVPDGQEFKPTAAALNISTSSQILAAVPSAVDFASTASIKLTEFKETAIAKAKNEIRIPITPISDFVGNSFTFEATATSGNPVKFEVTGGQATIKGQKVTFTKAGLLTLKATEAGSDAYLAAKPIVIKITISNN